MRLYRPAVRDNCLMVTAVSFQQQEGDADCGLFSIAAAYHSAVGDDFRGLTFSQNDMRQHLVECFERKQLSAFPQTSGTVTRNTRKHLFVHIHCEWNQKEAIGMESPKIYSSSRCKNLIYLCRTANNTTPSQVSQYRAENGNLRKSGSTFSYGTVFAPLQCLYQKEAMGMESPKIYSSCRCKHLTYLCGTANDPVSSKPVLGQERKFAELRVYLLPWYIVCTKGMLISKGSYGYGESKNVFHSSVEKSYLPVRTANDPTPSNVIQYKAENGNFRKSGSTFYHGTVFAPKQCLYQKEATGMESPKMYFSHRCKNLTYLCGTASDPVSSKPV